MIDFTGIIGGRIDRVVSDCFGVNEIGMVDNGTGKIETTELVNFAGMFKLIGMVVKNHLASVSIGETIEAVGLRFIGLPKRGIDVDKIGVLF